MATEATPQHYRLATGQALNSDPPKTANPGFKRGGKVSKPKPKTQGRKR